MGHLQKLIHNRFWAPLLTMFLKRDGSARLRMEKQLTMIDAPLLLCESVFPHQVLYSVGGCQLPSSSRDAFEHATRRAVLA